MMESPFIIRELNPRRDQLVLGGGAQPDIIKLFDGSQLRCSSPRCRNEPYIRRWFFNQLIYCRVAQEIGAPVLQVEACRLGEQVFLCSAPLEWNRLDESAFQNKRTRTKVSTGDGYNVTDFYNCLQPEKLNAAADQFVDLLVTDQLLWMLDRTPDNVLGVCDNDGKYARIVGIDHEHCLALGVDPDPEKPQPDPASVQQRCHPTQMSHLFGSVSLDIVRARAEDARKKASREFVCDFAHDLATRLSDFLPGNEHSALNQHATLTVKLFYRLWEFLPGKMLDFFESYAPLLRSKGLHP